jgi:hypothetical protein
MKYIMESMIIGFERPAAGVSLTNVLSAAASAKPSTVGRAGGGAYAYRYVCLDVL